LTGLNKAMKFEKEANGTCTVVTVKVEKLDALHAPELKSELVFINKGGEKNIVLDMNETRYCDSSGLSAILVANRLCRDNNGKFVLCGLQPAVEKLIQISQLHNVLEIAPNREDALSRIS
jgi:anti-sigma B factor antagonist